MFNVVTLSGYLIRDIAITTEEGEMSARSTIAVFQKNGQLKNTNEETLLIDLVFRKDLIAFALDNLHGGSKVFVDGRIYEKNSKHYVIVESVQILDCVSQSSSSNLFCIDNMDSEENGNDQNLFEDSIDIDVGEGVKIKL
ncbi:single-stranded DNA-binding protein [Sulfuricurvum sp.]|uniref:single-stranded DNA-binding protein n=1 Tax=Sulfuricurvum sp. TaxID=2025608 RepID=UPI0026158D12|nr:single-stranded DNA-binding protein [Sulfuricurvum sp.]MDD2267059.1 single-stranded DNA-binding protein [Sulfuricurvum sp.]